MRSLIRIALFLLRPLCWFGRHRYVAFGTVAEVFGNSAVRKNKFPKSMPAKLKGDEHVVRCSRLGCGFKDIWRKR